MYAMDSQRDVLRKSLLSLEYSPVELLNRTISYILELLKDVETVVLERDEFLSLISLFTSRPRHFIVTSIFKILLKSELDKDQVLLFLNCYQKQQPENGPYSHVSWSFLEKGAEIKHAFIAFLSKLVLSNKLAPFKEEKAYSVKHSPFAGASGSTESPIEADGISSFDVVQVLFFLLDDENAGVRLKSYEYTSKIIKKEKKEWSAEEKQKFKRGLAYFGTGSLKVLKKEYRRIKKNKKEIKVKKTRFNDVVKIYVRLGQKIRQRNPRICIEYTENKDTKEITTQRKHTTVYIKYEAPITIIVKQDDNVLFETTYSSPEDANISSK